MSSITNYPAKGTPAGTDVVPIVDVEDTSSSSAGTTKKATIGSLPFLPVPSGTPGAGQVPLATGSGQASAWGPYPDQEPALAHALTGTTGITSLLAAIANRNNARVDIPVIGDSFTEGMGATAFTSRYIAQLNRAIRAYYPTTVNGSSGGLGFIPIQVSQPNPESTYTWPVTQTAGSVTSCDLGPIRNATLAWDTATFTWTAPTGTTSVQIMYYDGPAGTFTWQIDSGSTTTITQTNTAVDLLTSSIPITGGQVLTIAYASGAAIVIDGLLHFAGDESAGITFHGCGHGGFNSGAGTSGWNLPETIGGLNWAQCYNLFSPAAVAIMLGGNDARSSPSPVGTPVSAAQFQANMLALIALLRAQTGLASVPLLLFTQYEINATFVSGSWAPYVQAIRNVQAATPNSVIIDFNYRMPPVVSNFDNGAFYYDNFHPSNLGHALMGEIIAAGLRVA